MEPTHAETVERLLMQANRDKPTMTEAGAVLAKANPGGWPTGPLLSEWQYERRDRCNAVADLLDAVVRAWRLDRLVVWLNRRLSR